MAAKVHVDSSVGERRLRPIYDWLDNGNNKKALQEAEKVLKKQPNFQCAKVLKALALLRLGKEDECMQLLDAVRTEIPCDDSTLQAMTICYREIHNPERICEIYEAATKKEPNNEELLTHLFMSYVRVADYKKQQQTAMALYKLKPKNPYYFWAVMSVVMQAHKADEKLAKTVVLPLAERMVKKFVSDGKIEAEQEVQLYLMILEMQGKYDEALQVVEGPLGEKLISYVFIPLKRASLLMKLERWRDTNILYKLLLREDMDRWSYYMDYFTSALALLDSGQNDSAKVADSVTPTDSDGSIDARWQVADCTLEMCKDFLSLLLSENEALSRRLRGPYLAYLEFYRRLHERGDNPEEFLGDIVELFMRYFRNFGDKPCCVSDLKMFLPLLPNNRTKDFIQKVNETVGLREGELPSSIRRMQQHISSVQLSRCVGCHMDLNVVDKLALASSLLQYYDHGHTFNRDVLQTEFACNDPYALLAAHILYDVWVDTGSSQHIYDAILVLEYALTVSPSNFHIKLLLLRFYTILGAGGAAHRVYELLDVKHMQLDSLGYYHCNHIFVTGQLAATSALYEATLKFFTGNYKDSADHLTFSYKFGSFLKIEEFVEFRERLKNSLHYALVTIERILFELVISKNFLDTVKYIEGMDVTPEKDKVDWDNLQDNRDVQVITSWDPHLRQVSKEIEHQIFLDDMSFLRIRNLTVRCLAAAVDIGCANESNSPDPKQQHHSDNVEPVMNGEIKDDAISVPRYETFVKICDELLSLYESFTANPTIQVSQNVIGAPLPSRLYGYLASSSCCVLLELFGLIKLLIQDNEDESLTKMASTAAELVTSAVRKASGMIKVHGSDGTDQLAGRRGVLEYVVNTVEMISFAAILCGVGHSLVRPFKATLIGKSKKKKKNCNNQRNQQSQLRRIEVLNKLVSELQGAAEELDSALEYWESLPPTLSVISIFAEDLPSHLQALCLFESEHGNQNGCCNSTRSGLGSAVDTKLYDSHMSSLREIRNLLQVKIKYLSSVKI
ncbi:N-alpha-acetyltransferase 25, NatB auxiliary subunit isoform X3 [Zootermopsis nevadensis]|nr:N-alpha-acetyltransferase 25, NatB auxiliary subunit isoform X3 [Zootermopsis nevadensis]